MLITAFLLFNGSSFLELAVVHKPYLPFGTLITWMGMIAIPCTIYWGIKELRKPSRRRNHLFSRILKVFMILAILWAPICALLAGNLAFNFSEVEGFQGGQTAMRWFWRYSYGLPIASFVFILTYWFAAIVRRVHRNS